MSELGSSNELHQRNKVKEPEWSSVIEQKQGFVYQQSNWEILENGEIQNNWEITSPISINEVPISEKQEWEISEVMTASIVSTESWEILTEVKVQDFESLLVENLDQPDEKLIDILTSEIEKNELINSGKTESSKKLDILNFLYRKIVVNRRAIIFAVAFSTLITLSVILVATASIPFSLFGASLYGIAKMILLDLAVKFGTGTTFLLLKKNKNVRNLFQKQIFSNNAKKLLEKYKIPKAVYESAYEDMLNGVITNTSKFMNATSTFSYLSSVMLNPALSVSSSVASSTAKNIGKKTTELKAKIKEELATFRSVPVKSVKIFNKKAKKIDSFTKESLTSTITETVIEVDKITINQEVKVMEKEKEIKTIVLDTADLQTERENMIDEIQADADLLEDEVYEGPSSKPKAAKRRNMKNVYLTAGIAGMASAATMVVFNSLIAGDSVEKLVEYGMSMIDVEAARKGLFSLLVKAGGLDAMLVKLGNKLTTDQIEKLSILDKEIPLLSGPKKNAAIKMFFEGFYGKIYSVKEIKEMDKKELKYALVKQNLVKSDVDFSSLSSTMVTKYKKMLADHQEQQSKLTIKMAIVGGMRTAVNIGSTFAGAIAIDSLYTGFTFKDQILNSSKNTDLSVEEKTSLEIASKDKEFVDKYMNPNSEKFTEVPTADTSLLELNAVGAILKIQDKIDIVAQEKIAFEEKVIEEIGPEVKFIINEGSKPLSRAESKKLAMELLAPEIDKQKMKSQEFIDQQERAAAAIKKLHDTARERALARATAKAANLVIPDTIVPPPTNEQILPSKLADALDFEFTPLLRQVAGGIANMGSAYIAPSLINNPMTQQIDSMINKVNIGIAVTEGLVDLNNILGKAGRAFNEVKEKNILGDSINALGFLSTFSSLPEIEKSIEINPLKGLGSGIIDFSSFNLGKFDLSGIRLPTIKSITDRFITDKVGKVVEDFQMEKVNLKVIVLESLTDKIMKGWSNERFYVDVARKIVGKDDLDMINRVVLSLTTSGIVK